MSYPKSKSCSTCGLEKDLDEFYPQEFGLYGRRSKCRICLLASGARWSLANPNYNKEYYLANAEEILLQKKEYSLKNPEKISRKGKQYRLENSEQIKEAAVARRLVNPKHFAYLNKKYDAKSRGIPFLLTEEEFIEEWGDEFDSIGPGGDDKCLCRYDDEGAYQTGNCYIATRRENTSGPRPLLDRFGENSGQKNAYVSGPLTPAQVIDIFDSELTQRALGEKHGMSDPTIGKIKRGEHALYTRQWAEEQIESDLRMAVAAQELISLMPQTGASQPSPEGLHQTPATIQC